jgi:radical SAM superfamily enzyme YgiQ (UPF0313 family)
MKLALACLENNEPDPPLGLAYLAAYVRQYSDFGDDIIIIDKDDPLRRIRKEKPDIIGMTSFSFEFPGIRALAQTVKEELDVPIIIGGHHITGIPSLLSNSPFDVGVIGEGEQTLCEILNVFYKTGGLPKDELKNIRGIVFEENGELRTTDRREELTPLDKIPFPARDLLKMKDYYLVPRRGMFGKFGMYAQMITSRGCPYRCIFCSTPRFWRRTRFHSARYVVNEMKMLIEKYKVDGMLIWDDLFIADFKRVEEIAKLMKEEIGDKINMTVFARANLINEQVCKILKGMNVVTANFGFESGSEKTLNYLKRGTVTVADNKRAIELCNKYDIRTIGTFIIGAPEETEEDIKETRNLVLNEKLNEAHIFQLTPEPNTDLWDYAMSLGIVSESPDFDFSKLRVRGFKPDFVMTKSMSKETLQNWYNTILFDISKKKYSASGFSGLKINHIKYLLSRRFVSKLLDNRKEVAAYLKTSLLK